MHDVPVQLPLISVLSKLRMGLPSDLKPKEARQSVLLSLQELEKCFPEGFPEINPVKDLGIDDPEFVELVSQIEELEQILLHTSQGKRQIKSSQRKQEVDREFQELKSQICDSQLEVVAHVIGSADLEEKLAAAGESLETRRKISAMAVGTNLPPSRDSGSESIWKFTLGNPLDVLSLN